MKKTLYEKAYQKAKEISHSKKWSKLLDTIDRKVRFEDGYAAGWLDRHYEKK